MVYGRAYEESTVEPIQCSQCDELIHEGEEYLEYDGMVFCSEECLSEYLLSQCDYETKTLGEDDHDEWEAEDEWRYRED